MWYFLWKHEETFGSTLHWRHNDHDSVSNHQPQDCLLNRLFRRRSKKTSKLCVTGLCVGNSPGPVNSPHKGPVTRKMFPFDDVIMASFLDINPLVQKTEYLGTIRWILWLLMPWLLASPIYQQPWYWLYVRYISLSYYWQIFYICVPFQLSEMTENAHMILYSLKYIQYDNGENQMSFQLRLNK